MFVLVVRGTGSCSRLAPPLGPKLGPVYHGRCALQSSQSVSAVQQCLTCLLVAPPRGSRPSHRTTTASGKTGDLSFLISTSSSPVWVSSRRTHQSSNPGQDPTRAAIFASSSGWGTVPRDSQCSLSPSPGSYQRFTYVFAEVLICSALHPGALRCRSLPEAGD